MNDFYGITANIDGEILFKLYARREDDDEENPHKIKIDKEFVIIIDNEELKKDEFIAEIDNKQEGQNEHL